MKTVITTAPTSYPVTLAEVKAHLGISSSIVSDDVLITEIIKAATDWTEAYCSSRWVTQTWDVYLDAFPSGDHIKMPFGKLQSVTTIKYTDTDAVETTWSSVEYVVDVRGIPGNVYLAYGCSWPTATMQSVNGVVIRFVTGYTSIPYQVKQAVKITCSHFYENREAFVVGTTGRSSVSKMPMSVESLLEEHRMPIFG